MTGIDNSRPWEHPEIREASATRYVIGYVMALAVLGLSLVLVKTHATTPILLLSLIGVLSLIAVMGQLILLFHLDFSETQRWNSLTLMLNVPLLILSVGLTSWMFHQLYDHVMVPNLMERAAVPQSASQALPPSMLPEKP
jgi:cytochrome o ubiquinol oxidase operon protein cyoD